MNLLLEFFRALGALIGGQPAINKLVIEVTLKTDIDQYRLDEYQRLNGTRLVRLKVPQYTTLTKSQRNLDIASDAARNNAYLTLMDIKSQAAVDTVPLGEVVDDGGYFTDKGRYNLLDIDWTKSYIRYPSNVIPNANNNKVVQIIVEYMDCSK